MAPALRLLACSRRTQLPVLTRLALDRSSLLVLHHQDQWLNQVGFAAGRFDGAQVEAVETIQTVQAVQTVHGQNKCPRGWGQTGWSTRWPPFVRFHANMPPSPPAAPQASIWGPLRRGWGAVTTAAAAAVGAGGPVDDPGRQPQRPRRGQEGEQSEPEEDESQERVGEGARRRGGSGGGGGGEGEDSGPQRVPPGVEPVPA
jgi:hypothetical protein